MHIWYYIIRKWYHTWYHMLYYYNHMWHHIWYHMLNYTKWNFAGKISPQGQSDRETEKEGWGAGSWSDHQWDASRYDPRHTCRRSGLHNPWSLRWATSTSPAMTGDRGGVSKHPQALHWAPGMCFCPCLLYWGWTRASAAPRWSSGKRTGWYTRHIIL